MNTPNGPSNDVVNNIADALGSRNGVTLMNNLRVHDEDYSINTSFLNNVIITRFSFHRHK
jgi:hypothetical protein